MDPIVALLIEQGIALLALLSWSRGCRVWLAAEPLG
jgi:hypothetical protein